MIIGSTKPNTTNDYTKPFYAFALENPQYTPIVTAYLFLYNTVYNV